MVEYSPTPLVTFTIPGEAVGKGRPRFIRATGRTYTPEKTARYENLVRVCYAQQVGNRMFDREIPLYMHVDIYMQVPKSVSKRKREMMLAGKILPTKKPDCSNILKAIEDGLNAVAYHDDSQIVAVTVTKRFGEQPGVQVRIREAIK